MAAAAQPNQRRVRLGRDRRGGGVHLVRVVGVVVSKLRVLDLFSGIGGFSLGLERTGGFETVAFCEIEPFSRRVLAKHWPEVPQYEDVTKLTGDILRRDGIAVDVITGGFPCQDISTAGKQAGMFEGTRSGLWSEIVRLIGDLSPRYVIVENVANLLSGPSEQRGGWFGRVLGDLAECGYDAEWENIPAAALGAPHRRERIWIVAYPNGSGHDRTKKPGIYCAAVGKRSSDHLGNESCKTELLAYPAQHRRAISGRGHVGRVPDTAEKFVIRPQLSGNGADGCAEAVADADGNDVQGKQPSSADQEERQGQITGPLGSLSAIPRREWSAEPAVGRVANGVPSRVDRLKGLGNAVVPQIPELIGRAILAAG